MSVDWVDWGARQNSSLRSEREGVIASGMGVEAFFPELIKSAARMDGAQAEDVSAPGSPQNIASGADHCLAARLD